MTSSVSGLLGNQPHVRLRTALIKRGPWAMIWQDDPEASRVPTLRIDSLAELPGKIAAFNVGAC